MRNADWICLQSVLDTYQCCVETIVLHVGVPHVLRVWLVNYILTSKTTFFPFRFQLSSTIATALRVPHFTLVTFTIFPIWQGRLVSLPEKWILSKFTCCESVQITSLLNDTAICMGCVECLLAFKKNTVNGIKLVPLLLYRKLKLKSIMVNESLWHIYIIWYTTYMKQVTPIRRCIGVTVVLH